jgi:extracellular matrix protein 14
MFSSHASLVHVGESYEGREILGVRLGKRPEVGDEPTAPRKAILITGGSHAREWISISSVNYLIYTMATLYGKSQPYTAFMDEFDWIFVPVLNPDGYEYSWNSDRLWRKNRQPGQWKFCKGIDLDRNWGFQFGTGQAGNPCSESFPGQDAWEAVETSHMREWVRNQTESGTEFVAYLDLHSYSQMILYPYSYSCESAPPTLENLQELALGLAKAMRLHGTTYRAAPACEGNVATNSRGVKTPLPPLESGGGSAIDWFYQEIKVKYAFQIKLRDTGSYGFLLPKEHIVPTGKEVLSAITYLGRFLRGEIGLLHEEQSPIVEEVTKSKDESSSSPLPDDQYTPRNSRMWPTKLDFRRRR